MFSEGRSAVFVRNLTVKCRKSGSSSLTNKPLSRTSLLKLKRESCSPTPIHAVRHFFHSPCPTLLEPLIVILLHRRENRIAFGHTISSGVTVRFSEGRHNWSSQ